MSDYSFCRLCLHVVPYEYNDESLLRELLLDVFPGLNLDLTEQVRLCSACSHQVTFIHKINKSVQREKKPETDQSCCICLRNIDQFCLVMDQNQYLSSTVKLVMQIVLNSFNPINLIRICHLCWSYVEKIYIFKKQCFEVEQSILAFCKTRQISAMQTHHLAEYFYEKFPVGGEPTLSPTMKQWDEDLDTLFAHSDGSVNTTIIDWSDKEPTPNDQNHHIFFCLDDEDDEDDVQVVKTFNKDLPRRFWGCHICAQKFKYKKNSVDHMLNHENRWNKYGSFVCMECPYKSNRKSSLTTHIRKSHQATKDEILAGIDYSCPYCRMIFKDQTTVQVHTAEHAYGWDMYACFQCSFVTNNSKCLSHHYKVHKS